MPTRNDRKHRAASRGRITPESALREYHDALFAAYGPQGWWPGESPTEIAIGAILTQNTNWKNVERAIENLRQAGLVDWAALRDIPIDRLAVLIRPAGYFNVKSRRLKNFVRWLWGHHRGDLSNLAALPRDEARRQLLSVNGIGPETADSILLYALEQPTFVVDAYTRRVLVRHGHVPPGADYEVMKRLFEGSLPRETRLFNEYHALIVAVGKRHCKPAARCQGCPLEAFSHRGDAC